MTPLNSKNAQIEVGGILNSQITGEYSWLDFKLKYSNNPVEFVHDILCLANARHNGNRYIVYGIQNRTWELKGIPNELVANDLYTLINNQVWNHKPLVLVDHVYINGLCFGFVAIGDFSLKPYYLRKAYRGIPAGAVYIRQGDTNTPYKSGTEVKSVEDGELEQMFRERLGIDKPLLERVETLLSQTDKWEEFCEDEEIRYFHEDFPEYQIRFFEPEIPDEESWEDWVKLHHKQTNLIEKESPYSRVERNYNMFGWGKKFAIYIHSTPVYQEGALIRIYKEYCPYPDLTKVDGRNQIGTEKSRNRGSRINYLVGAINCLKNRNWIHHTSEEPTGSDVFLVYNAVIRNYISTARAESNKEPMLVLDVDVV